MHVVHVYKDYPPVVGGIEHHLQLLAERQVRRGLRVTVLVTSRERHTSLRQENGVEVIRAARLAEIASTPLSLALVARLRSLSPDIVHLHFPYPLGEVAQLLSRRGLALVVTYHSDIVRQRWLGALYRPLARRLLQRADRILPTSEAYLQTSKVLAACRTRATVVPLGIETARFANPDPEGVAALGQRWPGPHILFVGRLRYYKGIEVLIEAVERLEATLLIVGDGPMADPWRQRAAAGPAAQRIHFLGEVPEGELPLYYAAADVFALPSSQRSEAFGLAQLEAMAAGTPVVSTELGTGTSFVNRHGETGLVVQPGEATALAAALDELLSDDAKRRAMGQNARDRAGQEFDADRMVERVLEIYDEVLDSSGVS